MPTHFANVDLDFKSNQDLAPIVKELGDAVYVLYCDKQEDHYLASLEVAIERNETDEADAADRTINQFCTLIESLSAEGRALWDNCFERVFDIGYEGGITPHCYRSTLQPSTIQRITQIGASILVTLYASDETPEDETPE